MKSLLPEFNEILKLLIKHEVNFMVIGGYAVIYHGYSRITKDLDIWIEPKNENREGLALALAEYGIDEDDVQKVRKLDLTQINFFFFGKEPRRIDFLTHVNNVGFTEAAARANTFSVDEYEVPIIDYHHLILTKITNKRSQDKADVDMLQKIKKYRKKP